MDLALPTLPDWGLPPLGFIWPQMLWLLLVIPAVVGLYFVLLRRKKKAALRYGNLAMVKIAQGTHGAWRRHVPPALYLAGLVFAVTAIARPTAVLSLASTKATVILAMDVSISMRAEDMQPSRIVAAQEAAKAFINEQPKDVQIGLVAFAASALLVQNPTTDHQALSAAIDRFELQRGTAVGNGILASLGTLFPNEEWNIPGQSIFTQGGGERAGGGAAPLGANPTPEPAKQPDIVEPGSLKTAIVILMTDGATTTGPNPIEAARLAAAHGLRVYTIGFGSREGSGGGFGGFGGFGGGYGRRMMNLDEEALKSIADITRAKYYYAGSSEDLKKVYQTLSKQRIVQVEETEITSVFAAIAGIFTLLSAGLSLLWFNRAF